MLPKYYSSREFNQDSSGAKRAANDGPVFITDRGKPSHVLISVDAYMALTGSTSNIVEMLTMDQNDDVDFVTPKVTDLTKPADLG